jgi:hypothetical protein
MAGKFRNVPWKRNLKKIPDGSYTKRKRLKQADEKLSSTITGLAAGFLGTGNDSVAKR